MIVKEYYKTSEVFTPEMLTGKMYVSDPITFAKVLNFLFLKKNELFDMIEDDENIVHLHATMTLEANNTLLNAIDTALKTDFDPMNGMDYTDETKGTGKDTTEILYKSTFINGIDTTDTDTTSTTQSSNTYETNTMKETEKSQNGGAIKHEGETTTQRTGTDTTSVEYGATHTTTHKGHNISDFTSVIASIYETKTINLFDKIIDMVSDGLVGVVYRFDEECAEI